MKGLRVNWPATVVVIAAVAVLVTAIILLGLGHPVPGVG